MGERWLSWLVRRLRPVRGWLLLLLAGVLALLLPLSLESASWVRNLDGLWRLSLAAMLTGAWLASRRWFWPYRVALACGIGTLLTVQWASPFLPAVGRVLAEVSTTRQWLAAGAPASQPWPWFGLLQDVTWQLTGTWHDVTSLGDRVLLLRAMVAVLVGSSSFWMAWWLFREPGVHPWLAVLPTGILLALHAFFAGAQEPYLVFYLVAALGILAWGRWYQLEKAWADHGSDYPSDLGVDHSTAAAIIGAAALVMVLLVPQVTVQPAVNWFWQLARGPWEQVERQTEAYFPGLLRGSGGPLVSGNLRQGLPRQHLLGSGPELRDRIVFRVATNSTGAWVAPRWKQLTYAIYTGRGWLLEDDADLADEKVPAGRTWRHDQAAAAGQGGGRFVEQRVESVAGSMRLVAATGVPQAVNEDYRAVLRSPDDVVALELRDPQRRYIVDSELPTASESDLRIVNNSKTQNSNYLAVNNKVPNRVRRLAEDIVAGATNPYDQAKLLEAYLRTLSYDLDVPLVAEDRDLVDAFLFDLRRGYCDYFASAFVVMARSVGLPARLATGYASGTEVAPGEWVVTEADAHSWPEVYFEGAGWIPFEPTPSQPPSTRPNVPAMADVAVGAPVVAELALPPVRTGLSVVGLFAAAVCAWLVWRAWRAPQTASETYARVAAWGTRLGQPPRPGDTMRGYAAALADRLDSITRDVSTRRLTHVIQAIVGWCESTLYAPGAERPTLDDQRRLWHHWQRAAWLRTRLWLRTRAGRKNREPQPRA